ncbi:hypothetical protein FHX42_000132 [Saccharopolyspora lacisalsi]|uniref:Uncharacterized protein n=1 Tax=Halosaccharopolyspora lacisalsi TaxID=1000566 RepID=A0A839DP20_9PSEU|nr:hypothetical protein [Halosaccharopolyspora lacisalsi]
MLSLGVERVRRRFAGVSPAGRLNGELLPWRPNG